GSGDESGAPYRSVDLTLPDLPSESWWETEGSRGRGNSRRGTGDGFDSLGRPSDLSF
ncbi:Hypothetical predicted protein, partial [Marmota monax]